MSAGSKLLFKNKFQKSDQNLKKITTLKETYQQFAKYQSDMVKHGTVMNAPTTKMKQMRKSATIVSQPRALRFSEEAEMPAVEPNATLSMATLQGNQMQLAPGFTSLEAGSSANDPQHYTSHPGSANKELGSKLSNTGTRRPASKRDSTNRTPAGRAKGGKQTVDYLMRNLDIIKNINQQNRRKRRGSVGGLQSGHAGQKSPIPEGRSSKDTSTRNAGR